MTSSETHPFEQNPEATQVRVCRCGKWPDHHVHGGDPCGCDDCRDTQIRQYLDRNPAALRNFLDRDMRARPHWWRAYFEKQARIQGLRDPGRLLRW